MTQRLYYTNSYQKEFDAIVLAVQKRGEKLAICLDCSAFYPTSGGQPNDLGWLDGCPVVDVVAESGVIWHVIDNQEENAFTPGQTIHGFIDWPRRYDHMQQHSGQHLLSQVFERLFGWETVSVHIGDGENTLDLETPGLTPEQAATVEQVANEKVYANLPISAYFVADAGLAAVPLRRPPKVTGSIRIVEIADYDFSACGGTHCRAAGELGPIKITRWERRRGGVRVSFLCGQRALADYLRKHEWITTIAGIFTTDPSQTPVLVERNLAQVKELQRRLDELTAQLLSYEADSLLAAARPLNGARLVTLASDDLDVAGLRTLAGALIAKPGVIALLASTGGGKLSVVFARSQDLSLHVGNLLRNTLQQFGGSGGGRADFAQGGGPAPEQAGDILHFAVELAMENGSGGRADSSRPT
jgi:alanyl-tRNA synthetase